MFLPVCLVGCLSLIHILIDDLENYVPDKWSKSDLPMLAELVFYHVIIRKNQAKAQFYGKSFCSMLEGNEAVSYTHLKKGNPAKFAAFRAGKKPKRQRNQRKLSESVAFPR